MARFDRAIATALRLIAKNGQKATWRVIGDGTADPATPWLTAAVSPVDEPATICFLPFTRMNYETFVFRNGGEVPKGNLIGLMGNVSFTPNLKDVVIRDGVQLEIESIDLLSPNGQKVLYTVVFKQ